MTRKFSKAFLLQSDIKKKKRKKIILTIGVSKIENMKIYNSLSTANVSKMTNANKIFIENKITKYLDADQVLKIVYELAIQLFEIKSVKLLRLRLIQSLFPPRK